MKRILVAAAILTLLFSCAQSSRNTGNYYQSGHLFLSDNEAGQSALLPEDKEVKYDTLFISFDSPVGGYEVSAEWLLEDYGETFYEGPAYLHFKKPVGRGFSVFVENGFFLPQFDGEKDFVNGQHLTCSPVQKAAGEILSLEAPFFFSDVDFDGDDELLVSISGLGSHGRTAFYVYEKDGTRRMDMPFDEHIDSQTIFNSDEKSITLNLYSGAVDGCELWTYRRQRGGNFLLTDSTRVVEETTEPLR